MSLNARRSPDRTKVAPTGATGIKSRPSTALRRSRRARVVADQQSGHLGEHPAEIHRSLDAFRCSCCRCWRGIESVCGYDHARNLMWCSRCLAMRDDVLHAEDDE